MQEYKELIPLSDIHKKALANCVNDGIYRYKMCKRTTLRLPIMEVGTIFGIL